MRRRTTVHLSSGERELLERYAKARGLPLSTALRELAVARAARELPALAPRNDGECSEPREAR
jgi:hypothetical protein